MVPPSIITQPVNQFLLPSSNASFSVSAIGSSLLFTWTLASGQPLTGERYVGVNTSHLTVRSVSLEDDGRMTAFVCMVMNSAGNVTSSTASLTVVGEYVHCAVCRRSAVCM